MPCIIEPEHYQQWLDPDLRERESIQEMLSHYEGEDLTMQPVSTFVDKARNEGPERVVAPA